MEQERKLDLWMAFTAGVCWGTRAFIVGADGRDLMLVSQQVRDRAGLKPFTDILPYLNEGSMREDALKALTKLELEEHGKLDD